MKMQNQFIENVKKKNAIGKLVMQMSKMQNAIGKEKNVKNADLEQLNAKVKKKCKSLNNNA